MLSEDGMEAIEDLLALSRRTFALHGATTASGA